MPKYLKYFLLFTIAHNILIPSSVSADNDRIIMNKFKKYLYNENIHEANLCFNKLKLSSGIDKSELAKMAVSLAELQTRYFYLQNSQKLLRFADSLCYENDCSLEIKANVYFEKANYLNYLSEPQFEKKSLKYYKQALTIYESLELKSRVGLTKSRIGVVYSYLNKFDSAKLLLIQAIKVTQQFSNSIEYADCCINLGFFYSRILNLDKSLKYFNKAINIYKLLLPANHSLIGRNFHNLGYANKHLGNFDTAIDYLKRAIQIKKLNNESVSLAFSYSILSDAYYELNELDEALRFSKLTIKTLKNIKFNSFIRIARTNITIGDILLKKMI